MTGSDAIAERMIITAASPAYEDSLLALLGSLRVNWPGHPPLLVYDLGIGNETLARLSAWGFPVRRVPPFCAHWRKFFTWKLWCIHDAPARTYLWLDAGVCVLRPMPEAFTCAEQLGYFCVPNGLPQVPQASIEQARAMGLTPEAMASMCSITSGVHALRKDGRGRALLDEALRIGRDEAAMRPSAPEHRHDQSLLTGLFYKHFGELIFADGALYAGWRSPCEVFGQKIWVHRRRMLPEDVACFKRALDVPMAAHAPKAAPPRRPIRGPMRCWIRLAKRFGLYRNTALGPVLYDGVRD